MKNQNTQNRKIARTMPFSIETLIIGIYLIFGSCLMGFSQNVGINTDTPDNSALLEVSSTDKGVLIPRLTNAERNDIPDPATGLIIYNSDTDKFNFWDGDSWEELNDSFVSSVVGSGTAGDEGVSMNATGNDPDPSAMLDIASDGTDKKGLLIPRTTTGSVSTPAEGLMIYNTGTNMFSFYDGTDWQSFCHDNISTTTGSGTFTSNGNGINITDADPSAILEMASTSRGFLIPRLSETQRNDIIAPANGLMIYNATDKSIDFYTGTEWRQLLYDVPDQPGAISGNTTLCENATGETYSISSVSGATSYTWTVPSGASIASGQGTTGITVDFGASSGDICVTADNGCGAGASKCLSITVSSPTASINPDPAEMCAGGTLNMDGNPSGGSGTWSSHSWTGDTGPLTSTTSQTPDFTTSTSGTYSLTYTVTDDNGCTGSDDITVTVNSLPTADAGSDVSICNGNSTTIDVGGSSGTGTLSYSWDNGLGAGASHTVSPSSTTT